MSAHECPVIINTIGAFGDEDFEDAYDAFRRTVRSALKGYRLMGDVQVVYLQFLFGDVRPGTFVGISIGRFARKNRSISMNIRVDLDRYVGLQPLECSDLFMVHAITALRATGKSLQGMASNLGEISEVLQAQIKHPVEQNPRVLAITERIGVRDEPSHGDKALLVLQFSELDLDYDGLIALEESLRKTLRGLAQVDGHDIGSGESNIFIFTNKPREIFAIAREIIDNQGIPALKSGFRLLDDEDYTILWPAGLLEFKVS